MIPIFVLEENNSINVKQKKTLLANNVTVTIKNYGCPFEDLNNASLAF